MKLIAAVDKNWGIGNKGELLYHIPEDMKVFQYFTKQAGVVVMGRKTFESVGKLLPGRLNIIISSKGVIDYQPKESEKQIDFICFCSIEDVLQYIKEFNLSEKTYIIGGSSIYNSFVEYCSGALITKINTEAENVDSYFPNLDNIDGWENVISSIPRVYENIEYEFEYYNHSTKKEF